MADSSALCGVCCLRHLSKPSTGWCLECEEGLCVDCKEHHKLLKATRNHNIIPNTEKQKLPQNVLEITQNCRKHNEIVQIFCIKHDCPCCRKCIIETHNNCKDLIEIEDYIKDIKSSARFTELEEMLNETAENIRKICIDRQKNLTSLQEERKRIENDIVQTRIKINNYLDKLQADLIHDLYAKELNEIKKIQRVLKALEEREGHFKEFQTNFENIKKYASDIQLFLSMKQIENDMVKNEEFVQSMIDGEDLRQAVLVLKDTIDTEQITVNMPYIGKLGVDYSQSQVGITKKKAKQAAKVVIRPIERITAKFEKKITACRDGVIGCTILPRNKMAFVNQKEGAIIVVKSDGILDFDISLLPYCPFDITYIPDNNTIAVTSKNSHYIKIIDLDTRQVLKTYDLGSTCVGIAYTNGRLIVCSKGNGIREFNQHDGSVKTIVSENISNYSYLAISGDKIYHTNLNSKSVICNDLQGKIQWTFKNSILKSPLGVTVDTDGNVFVAGNASHNVVVISPDGQRYKQMLSSEAGINCPNALIYNRQNNQLLVTNHTGGAFLFNVA